MFSPSIQKQMDERASNPNNVIVLTSMIVPEYFDKHVDRKKDNPILFRRRNRRARQIQREQEIQRNQNELSERIEEVLSQFRA